METPTIILTAIVVVVTIALVVFFLNKNKKKKQKVAPVINKPKPAPIKPVNPVKEEEDKVENLDLLFKEVNGVIKFDPKTIFVYKDQSFIIKTKLDLFKDKELKEKYDLETIFNKDSVIYLSKDKTTKYELTIFDKNKKVKRKMGGKIIFTNEEKPVPEIPREKTMDTQIYLGVRLHIPENQPGLDDFGPFMPSERGCTKYQDKVYIWDDKENLGTQSASTMYYSSQCTVTAATSISIDGILFHLNTHQVGKVTIEKRHNDQTVVQEYEFLSILGGVLDERNLVLPAHKLNDLPTGGYRIVNTFNGERYVTNFNISSPYGLN